MQNACAAFFVGALMLVGSAVLLWWNEGTAVERYETLELARREVLELGEGARAGSGGRGRLVHVTAVASGEVLDDGISIGRYHETHHDPRDNCLHIDDTHW